MTTPERGLTGPNRAIHEANRLSWNAATRAHNSHKREQVAYVRQGGTTLFDEERRLLGDLTGQRVAHLLCNAGQDTLGLVQLGAASVVGIDISDVAITAAKELTAAVGAAATFVRADVYDWLHDAARRGNEYDVIFTSYGALCWLSDLDAYLTGISRLLAPGGRYVTVEFHPVAMMFDEAWRLVHGYFGSRQPVESPGVPDYVAEAGDGLVPWGYTPGVTDFVNPHPDFTFQWSLGEIVSGLIRNELRITALEEYPYSNGAALLPGMRALPDRRWAPPPGIPELPLMFGLIAERVHVSP